MSTKDYSTKQEKQVAKALGGYVVPASGATSFIKGDVIVGDILVECKTKVTPSSSFTLQKLWIDKLNEERIAMGKDYGVIAVSFDGGESSSYLVSERFMQDALEVMLYEHR